MTTDKKLWRNRKERKQWARRLQSEDPGLEVIHPHAAGIDVGTAPITSQYDQNGTRNPYGGLSVLQQTASFGGLVTELRSAMCRKASGC
jgi:hypothetical protein